MPLLSVYVEGAMDSSALGVKRLAALIAARYGLSAADLEKRLASGRFRVKANVDEETAKLFAADLEGLGARCSILAMEQRPPSAAAAPPRARDASLSLAGRPGAPSASAPAPARVAASARAPEGPAPQTAAPNAPIGLAAARDDSYHPGALGALDSATFALATLDGQEDSPPDRGPGAFGEHLLDSPAPPIDSELPTVALRVEPSPRRPSGAPALEPSRAERPGAPPHGAPPKGAAIDLFAPPSEGDDLPVTLVEEPRLRRGSLAPESMAAPVVAAPQDSAASASHGATSLHRKQRGRQQLAAGVLLSVLVGFGPVHLFARDRERDAFEKIDNHVRAAQSEITSMEEWTALDELRAVQDRQKRAAHQEIVILSLVLWVVVSGGLSVGWVRLAMPRLEP